MWSFGRRTDNPGQASDHPDMASPPIAFTPGEPAGIGPDLCVQLARVGWPADLVALADPAILSERATRLRAGDNAGYLARFTPYSQAKMKNWLAKMPPEVLADYQTGNPSRKIYFRLDAEPVDIVFYQLIDAQGNAIEDTVRWDYLLHDGGAGYLLTNAYAQSQLDDVLAMTGRFEKGMVEFVRSFGP